MMFVIGKQAAVSIRNAACILTTGIGFAALPAGAGAGETTPALLVPTHGAATDQGSAKTLTASTCFKVDTIRIEGDRDIVAEGELREAAAPFAVDCQGNESVSGLIKAINGLLADKGYVTTQAWLPEQDIAASRELKLRIVAGRIDRVVYREEHPEEYRWLLPRMAARSRDLGRATGPGDLVRRLNRWLDSIDDELDRVTVLGPSARIAMSSTISEGDLLHIDHIQDTLDSLNGVASAKAKAELEPGSKPSTSNVVVTNRVEDSFRLYTGFDTESIEGVDRLLFGVTAEKDNLLGINDRWNVTRKSGVDTNELAGGVAVPFGRVTLRANADWSETATELSPLAELFTTTWNAGVGMDWVIRSSKTGKLVFNSALTHRENNRYVNGLSLTAQRVTHLDAGLSWSRFFAKGSVNAKVGFDAGLPIFNAQRDPENRDATAPESQFFKLTGSLSGSYVIAGKASLSSLVVGQWSRDVLLSDDQLTIGGRSSVRGFANMPFKADSGVYWRNEIALALPVDLLLGKPAQGAGGASPGSTVRETLLRINPYGFADAGWGRDNANCHDGYRVSGGVGLRYGGPRLSLDVGYAFRLASDARSRVADDVPGEAFVNMQFKLF